MRHSVQQRLHGLRRYLRRHDDRRDRLRRLRHEVRGRHLRRRKMCVQRTHDAIVRQLRVANAHLQRRWDVVGVGHLLAARGRVRAVDHRVLRGKRLAIVQRRLRVERLRVQ